jgi:hypothetical protein
MTSRPDSAKPKMVRLGQGVCQLANANQDAAVMNYTEMEAKVREATNNEPWGKRIGSNRIQ